MTRLEANGTVWEYDLGSCSDAETLEFKVLVGDSTWEMGMNHAADVTADSMVCGVRALLCMCMWWWWWWCVC